MLCTVELRIRTMNLAKLTDDGIDKDIVIIAVGNGACNCIRNMVNEPDVQNMHLFLCNNGNSSYGDDSEKCRQDTINMLPDIDAILDDNVKKVILVSTLGGCTGSVATPILAEYITKKRVEVYCIVSLPFIFEGEQTMKKAQKAVAEMSLFSMQTLIFNSELYRRQSCNQSVIRFFILIDKYFHKSIFSISKGR